MLTALTAERLQYDRHTQPLPTEEELWLCMPIVCVIALQYGCIGSCTLVYHTRLETLRLHMACHT